MAETSRPTSTTWTGCVAVLAVLALGNASHAADRPVAGWKLQLRRGTSGKQKLYFLSRDPAVLFPTAGGPDDPTTGTPGGLTIELFSQQDPARPAFTAPAGLGNPGWRTKVATYVYKNGKAVPGPSPVKAVTLKQGKTLSVVSAEIGLALTGTQGGVAVRITTGTLRDCAVFGPGTIRRDQAGNFLALKAPVPGIPDCSDASLGAGAPTTSTVTTVTTVTSVTSTTSTSSTLPPGVVLLDVTTGTGSGSCGRTLDASNVQIKALACGGLDLGGGSSSVPEGFIPDGVTNRFSVTNCTGSACDLVATAVAPGGGVDCTDAGCRFGPPLPIPNSGLSTCVVNTFATPGSGTLDQATGALSLGVPLASEIFLTGNATQPCPRCSAVGAPGNPASGTCDRGARAGLACTTTNSQGLSSDCVPGGGDNSQDLGAVSVNLSPLATTGAARTKADGAFCPGQTHNQGCFGSTACRAFSVDGLPAGALAPNTPQPVTLAAAFCIPTVSSGIVNGAASLPGPGAASLPGTVTLLMTVEGGTTTTSTTVTSTTSVTSTSGTTTTSTTATSTSSTTSSTILPPLLPLTVEFASVAGSGACGTTRDGSGAVTADLACGDLALGSGTGAIPPSALPDGAVVHFKLGGCSVLPLLTCALDAQPTPGPGFDCTTTGCHFGAPVPVPNGSLSACAVSTFSAPASGSVNLLTGATTANIALDLHVFVTLDPDQPCPRCSATGAPGAIGTGTCDRGARAGLACATTNSHGLSEDCLPGGTDGSIDVGTIAASLAPVTTGTATLANPAGLFCLGQTAPGCFGDGTCRSIAETGTSPGVAITSAVNPQPATLVSTFCVPATGNILLDGPAGLPGPAAISLPGLVRSQM